MRWGPTRSTSGRSRTPTCGPSAVCGPTRPARSTRRPCHDPGCSRPTSPPTPRRTSSSSRTGPSPGSPTTSRPSCARLPRRRGSTASAPVARTSRPWPRRARRAWRSSWPTRHSSTGGGRRRSRCGTSWQRTPRAAPCSSASPPWPNASARARLIAPCEPDAIPSTGTSDLSALEGVWRFEVTVDEGVAAGLPPHRAGAELGVQTVRMSDGLLPVGVAFGRGRPVLRGDVPGRRRRRRVHRRAGLRRELAGEGGHHRRTWSPGRRSAPARRPTPRTRSSASSCTASPGAASTS